MNLSVPLNLFPSEQHFRHVDVLAAHDHIILSAEKYGENDKHQQHNDDKGETPKDSGSIVSRQMIVTLLRKFRVADNPRKFALYECSHENDEDTCTLLRKMTRIPDDVCPLKVVLSWQTAKCGRALVLQENDTGDILENEEFEESCQQFSKYVHSEHNTNFITRS
ncbi:unnamed protein product [Nippostrongylus brasiliensis]|uniref:Ras-associating domain-containing protein n=1 Tax=Nippostrongylus brasiliensis TaxID=27835 RepID=A0A0N4Y2A7_NIPBR|nr:unnamed protein product [Nippostrongylus brasiliensis]